MNYIDREGDHGEAVTIQSVHMKKSLIMEKKEIFEESASSDCYVKRRFKAENFKAIRK